MRVDGKDNQVVLSYQKHADCRINKEGTGISLFPVPLIILFADDYGLTIPAPVPEKDPVVGAILPAAPPLKSTGPA
jgi:hypothetical protein